MLPLRVADHLLVVEDGLVAVVVAPAGPHLHALPLHALSVVPHFLQHPIHHSLAAVEAHHHLAGGLVEEGHPGVGHVQVGAHVLVQHLGERVRVPVRGLGQQLRLHDHGRPAMEYQVQFNLGLVCATPVVRVQVQQVVHCRDLPYGRADHQTVGYFAGEVEVGIAPRLDGPKPVQLEALLDGIPDVAATGDHEPLPLEHHPCAIDPLGAPAVVDAATDLYEVAVEDEVPVAVHGGRCDAVAAAAGAALGVDRVGQRQGQEGIAGGLQDVQKHLVELAAPSLRRVDQLALYRVLQEVVFGVEEGSRDGTGQQEGEGEDVIALLDQPVEVHDYKVGVVAIVPVLVVPLAVAPALGPIDILLALDPHHQPGILAGLPGLQVDFALHGVPCQVELFVELHEDLDVLVLYV